MTATACLRRATGLVAAYAIALQAIFASSVLAVAATTPGAAGIVCSAHEPDGAALPPSRMNHDCAAACTMGGCNGTGAGASPSSGLVVFAVAPDDWRAAAPFALRHTMATPHGARSPPVS
jgi:hypothetical protein